MAQTTIGALDASIVEINAPHSEIDLPGATTFAVFQGLGYSQEFTGGDHGFGDVEAARDETTFTETYGMHGGTLRVATFTQHDAVDDFDEIVHLGAWRGGQWSVVTNIYQRPSQELVALFNLVRITETPFGPVLESSLPHEFTLVDEGTHAPDIIHYLPGAGLLNVWARTPQQEWLVPQEEGVGVRGGELFLSGVVPALPGIEDEVQLLLVGETALTRIAGDPGVSEDALMQTASELQVTWRLAGAAS